MSMAHYHHHMDAFYQSVVGVDVYFQSIVAKEQVGRQRQFLLSDNDAKAVWEDLKTLNIGEGLWRVSPADEPKVFINKHNGDLTITTASWVFDFPEPYMEDDEETLFWQQFVNRVRALEPFKKKKLSRNNAFSVIQDRDAVRMPQRVKSPIPRDVCIISGSSTKHGVPVSPNTVIIRSSTPTTSPSSSYNGSSSKDSRATSKRTATTSDYDDDDEEEEDNIECEIASIIDDRLWGEDTEENAANALQSLYHTFVDNEHCIIEKNCRLAYVLGAPLAVVEVMARHNTSANIQEYGCELLSCMTAVCKQQQQQQQQQQEEDYSCSLKNQEQNELFLKLGGLWRVRMAMDHFHDNPAVIGPACWFIGNVVDLDLAQQVAGDCSLMATISAMQKHPGSVTVQEYGCYVLRNFILRAGNGGATMVVDAGGIERVIAAIHKHLNDLDVLHEGCTVLAKLAELNLADHRQRIIHAKGLVALSEVIRIYQHDIKGTVVENASRAMSILVQASTSGE